MDPFTILSLVGAGSQLIGGLVGYLTSQGKEDEAQAILDKARNEYGGLSAPALEKAAMAQLGPSELAKVKTDPAFKQAQLESLDKMKEIEANGGMTMEDRANINKAYNETARRESGQRQLITENMASRGVGGSGAELAMQLANSQGAADRNMQAGLDVAGQAQKRYFDAIRARGAYAGQLRDQDYNEQAKAAEAQDAINRFNKGFQFDQLKYNNSQAQQGYENQLGLADRRYGIARDQAADIRRRADQQRNMWGNIGQGVGNAARAGAGMYQNSAAATAGESQYAQPQQYPGGANYPARPNDDDPYYKPPDWESGGY